MYVGFCLPGNSQATRARRETALKLRYAHGVNEHNVTQQLFFF